MTKNISTCLSLIFRIQLNFHVSAILFVLFSFIVRGQTTLISPTGDGGFETGTTFANNNWTVVNAATNTWQVGTAASAYAGSRGAYVSNNSGTTWAYSTTTAQTSHIYRDVTVPAGESNIQLSFFWKGSGESGWDRLLVSTAPTTTTVTAGTPASSSTSIPAATLVYTQASYIQSAYTQANVTLGTVLAGTTFRLIFTWQNDGSGGTSPGAAIDNISLTSSCLTTPAAPTITSITSTGMTVNWGAVTNATSYNLEVSTNAGFTAPISGSPFSVAGTSQALTGLTSGNTYYVRVTAVGPNCNSAASTSANSMLTCIAPSAQASALSFSAATTSSITGSFTAASGTPTGYLIVRSTSSTLSSNPVNGTTYTSGGALGGGTVVGTPGSSTSISTTGLTAATQYYFFVFAYNSTSCTGGPVYNTTSPLSGSYWTCPSTPSTPTFSGITSTGLTVNWTAVTSASSYSLEVSTNSGFTAPISGSPFSVSGTSQALTGLTSGNTYYVRVTAAGPNCNSAASTSANSMLTCIAPSAQASALSFSAATTSSITGSFTAASGTPTGYLIVRSTSSTLSSNPVNGTTYSSGGALGGGIVVGTPGSSTIISTTSLTAGTQYYFFVFAYSNTACLGPVYNIASPLSGSYWTCPSTPSTPTFSGITGTGLTVNWTTVTSATSYSLEVSTNVGFTAPISGSPFSVAGTSQALTSLTSGNTYYVRVTAVGPNCNSAASTSANSILTCIAPSAQASALSFSAATTSSITGSFTAASGTPTGYLIVRSTSSTLSSNPVNGTTYTSGGALGGGTVVGTPGSSTSISTTGLTAATQYYFFVFAYNSTSCTGGPVYNTTSPLSGSYWTCPSTPSTPTFSGISSTGLTVNWTTVTSATSYTLEVSTNVGFTAPISGSTFSIAGTSQALTGLTSGNTYYVRVTAVGPNCNSAASAVASSVLICDAPTSISNGITINTTTETTISASFAAATVLPTGYLVIRTANNTMPLPVNGSTYTVGSNAIGYIEYVSTAVGSWTSTLLSPGETAYYWVFSFNNGTCNGPVYSTTATNNSATTNTCASFNSIIYINGTSAVSGVSYPTISSAILALSACSGITQPTVLELTSSYINELSSNSLTLPSINGMSSTNTITIRPATGLTNMEITSSVAGATISIDGGDNWIIDGRSGGLGTLNSTNLTISNTSVSTSGMAIQILNDAVGNAIRYLNLKASFGSASTGVLVLSGGSTNITGNDNNTIEYNNINGNGSTFNGIYCSGSAIANDNAIIQYNNIYDFFNAASSTNGIQVASNNTSFTISNNAIYQTVTRTFTSANTHSGILISGSSGVGFTINGNQIGGGFTVVGGPTPSNKYTIAGTIANRYKALNLALGSSNASNVLSNTITGFDFTSSSGGTSAGGPWSGIFVSAGKVNIGSNTGGNIIGSTAGTGSIVLNVTSSGAISTGVFIEAIASDINILNNSIGSITTTGSTTNIAHGFTGISTLATGIIVISNNLIGSRITPNSINVSNPAVVTSTFQYLNGILNSGNSSNLSISYNTVSNLNNAYSPSSFLSNASSIICGISSTTGVATITGDTIRNLTANANSVNSGLKAAVVGISITSGAGATVNRNLIHSLSNTNSTAGTTISVNGISYSGATTGINLIERNTIYNLNNASPTSGKANGIYIVLGNANVQNNMIRLGYDISGASITTAISIYGIYEEAGTNNYYHNSIFIGGSNVSSTTTIPSTAAFYCSSASGTRSIMNNIFVNARSNSNASGGPKNYAIYLPTSVIGLTSNYNIFQTTGLGAVFGAISGGDRANFTAWKTSSSAPDANSINADPKFIAPTHSTAPNLHINQNLNSPADQAGTNIAAVSIDFDGDSRSSIRDIGADEFTSCIAGTYIGPSTGNWSDANNWCGGLPGSTSSVSIPSGNTVTLDVSATTLASLTIDGSLIIPTNTQLTVTGTLTNNGDLLLQDGATLVQGMSGTSITGTGTYVVEKALTGNSPTWNSTTSGRFWYMGVPMNSVARSSFGNYDLNTNRLFSYSESTKQYTNITDNAALLSKGTGYVHRRSTDGTLTFSAAGSSGLYGEDLTLSGLTRTPTSQVGFNLIANPYMAYLDWDAVTKVNVEPTYYLRSHNNTANDISALITYNALTGLESNNSSISNSVDFSYLAPLQAIWVRVGTAASTGSLAMTRSMLSHQTGNPGLKSSTIFPTLARVNLVDGARFDQMLVFMNQDMSNGVDQYDSEKMFVSGAPQLYTMAAGKKLVMNGLNSNKKKISVPLYLELPQSKVYNLQLAEYELEDGLILLEDKQEGTIQDFTIHDTYAFYANSGVLQNRFVLHFYMPDATITAQGPNNSWVAEEGSYTEGGNILISSDPKGKVQISLEQPETDKVEGMVQVTDANGRMVYSCALEGLTTEFQLNVPSGIYYLTVQSGNTIENKKVFIQE